jgi:hypothetical protein
MATGNIGRPGVGVNPLRGQNNVQGACDMGALPDVFPGYQQVTDAGARAMFEGAWATEPRAPALAGAPGLTVTEMVEAFGRRELRALYVLGEDIAMTEPDLNHARASLAAGELLVHRIMNSFRVSLGFRMPWHYRGFDGCEKTAHGRAPWTEAAAQGGADGARAPCTPTAHPSSDGSLCRSGAGEDSAPGL